MRIHTSLVVVAIAALAAGGAVSIGAPCVNCEVDGDLCMYCAAGRSDWSGSYCRTGGDIVCPNSCFAWGSCEHAQGHTVVFVAVEVVIASASDPGGGPLASRPLSELPVLHAETILGARYRPEEAVIGDGRTRLGIGLAPTALLTGQRELTVQDLDSGQILMSGAFAPDSPVAVAVPGTTESLLLRWRTLQPDEAAAQRAFRRSLRFAAGGHWKMERR